MDLIQNIFNAGIVGCGGAGFPTHVKLNAKPEYFIINGAECEPLLRTDRYIMTNLADRLIAGADAILQALNIKNGYIAVKDHYKEEIAALQKAINDAGSSMQIHLMESFYPAGDEQIIVYEVTGRVVPPAGIPLDVGAVVDNVATVLAIADAIEEKPLTDKYLTVTGEVKSPVVLHVPVGTSFTQCIEMAGGALIRDYIVVAGGPMMGRTMSKEEAERTVVTKTTSGILILPVDTKIGNRFETDMKHMLNRAKSACIQCSFCTDMCPRHMLGHPLKPHKIMRKMAVSTDVASLLDDPDIRQASICCECGICETYACPMGLNPRTINGMLKKELAKAGIRYERKENSWTPNENRDMRKAPTMKVAYRAGVGKYYDYSIKKCLEAIPDVVEIPIKMHIGAPSEPCVADGQCVAKGQLIAKCPEGKLGANIHASISGTVELVKDCIKITG